MSHGTADINTAKTKIFEILLTKLYILEFIS